MQLQSHQSCKPKSSKATELTTHPPEHAAVEIKNGDENTFARSMPLHQNEGTELISESDEDDEGLAAAIEMSFEGLPSSPRPEPPEPFPLLPFELDSKTIWL